MREFERFVNKFFLLVKLLNQGLKVMLKNNQFLPINYHLFGPPFVQSLQKWLGNPEYLLPVCRFHHSEVEFISDFWLGQFFEMG